jgi:hypothetical protein
VRGATCVIIRLIIILRVSKVTAFSVVFSRRMSIVAADTSKQQWHMFTRTAVNTTQASQSCSITAPAVLGESSFICFVLMDRVLFEIGWGRGISGQSGDGGGRNYLRKVMNVN